MDRSDQQIVRWVPEHGPPHRFRFEPCADGSFMRAHETWNGQDWQFIGQEPVTDVELSG